MSAEYGRAIWRVTAHDGVAREHAFDAQVVVHGAGGPESREEHVSLPVPYEGELPDIPFTLRVQSLLGAGALTVHVRCFAPDGTPRVSAGSALPHAEIHRTASGIYTGPRSERPTSSTPFRLRSARP